MYDWLRFLQAWLALDVDGRFLQDTHIVYRQH